jgi:pimeloyl-ACP methyl ester carboxylesterase
MGSILILILGSVGLLLAVSGAALSIYSNRQAAIAEAQVPPIGKFVKIDGVRLHYLLQGSGSPIVLVHGLAGNLRNFSDTIVQRLARNYTVIVIDRPGSGYSDSLPDGNANVQDQAAFIHRVLSSLGIKQPIFVGHSLGGAVSLAYALQYPAETRALVLVAPATVSFRPRPPLDNFAVASPFLQTLLSETVAVPISIRSGAETIRAIFAPDAVPADIAIAGGAVLSRRPTQVRANFRDFSQLGAGLDTMQPKYHQLTLPIRIIVGTRDNVLQSEVHIKPFDGMSNVEVTRIDNAGHMLIYSQPDQILEAVAALEGK